MKKYKMLRQGIMLSIIFCSIVFSISVASAVDKTYYWDRTTGVSIAGYTTNWSSCSSSSPQNGYRVTSLKSSASSCTNGQLTRTNAGDLFLAIFPTTYSSDTQIIGKTNARFYLRSNSGYATYRFDLGYAKTGTFTSVGNVTKTGVPTSGSTHTIDLSTINGIAPSGSNLALKVSVTTSGGGRVYMGTNGGTSNSNSGRFYVNETVAIPTPTYTISVSTYPVGLSPQPTGGGTYNSGVTATVVAQTVAGYTFQNWTEGGTQVSTSASYSFTVTGNRNLVAVYTQNPAGTYNLKVSANRYVVLDDPNTGTISTGFPNPDSNWGTSYWSGESTTIRSIALVVDNTGKPKSGVTVNFNLKNPGGSSVNTAPSSTNVDGIAYYYFDINEKKYWGNWIIEASATIDGSTKQSSTTFVLDWWGCASCHNSKGPGNWGSYTPKSYYTMGYSFHRSQSKNQHTRPMSDGNCMECHRSYDKSPDWHTGKVACAGCHAGSDISSTPQGKNPEIAGCYDTAGCHPKKNTNPDRENSTTGYVVGGSYKTKYSAIPTNSVKSHTTGSGSVECILCHNAGHSIKKPYNDASSSNPNTENDQCWNCHTNRQATHKSNTNCVACHSQNAHGIATAGGGGPDCISCHDATGSATHIVDANAMTLGEHTNLNSGATATGVPVENKKCWGCHQTGGIQPASGSMGDRYTSPYKCYDCHNATKPYANVDGALTVSEHFKGGADIQSAVSAADNSTSCIACHNISEMKVSYTEIDGLNNGNSLASHYGKNRGELRTGEGGSTDCKYCHQNISTAFFDAMTNTDNKNMGNHSGSASTPVCITCHSTGKLHDSTLTKPVSSDDTYCKTCHTAKSEHKTLYCTECHANNADGSKAGREIHGIKYLQKDNTFSTAKTNAVSCTTCHQSSVVDGSLGTFTPEKTGVLHHSNNLTNGTRWDNYWTSSNPIEACQYCHNDTRHSATPLGRPLIWNPSYIVGTTIGSGTNCADCHYSRDSNYLAMNTAFTGAGLKIPPEITSGSWNGKSGYFNHSLGDYSDVTCKGCHYKGTGTTVGQVLHNVSEGTGGGDGGGCIGCHTSQQGSYPGIDTAVFTKHKNVNTSDGFGNLTDSDCKTCHYDTTIMSNVLTKTCNDCHTGSSGPITENHRPVNGVTVNITTGASCSTCHNNSIAKFSYSANASTSHYATKTSLISTKDCLSCHKNSAIGGLWGGATDPWNSPTFPHSLTTTTKEECYICHGDISAGTTSFHNKTLKKPPLSSVTCLDCHKLGTNLSKTKIDSSVSTAAVHKDKNCTDCHTGATTGNMNTYSNVANPPVVCTNCHTGVVEHQPAAPDVKTTISCKDCHNNNGMYKVNVGTNGTEDAVVHYLNDTTNTATTQYGHNVINTSNCMLCHNGPYTNDPTWGSPKNITTLSGRPHTETTIEQCDVCHKDNTVSTLVNVDFHDKALKAGAGGDNCVGCHAGNE